MLSNIMVQIGNHTNAQVEESMVRHMVLNSIRMYRSKFCPEFGEFVIACDNKNYWRRQIFPYYKANRKKSQAASELNWKEIFECLNKIRAELKEFFPYRVVDVESAEADDVIATLCKGNHQKEKILILSGDKDFVQLQRYDNVQQYDPVRKKFLVNKNPLEFLKEHILKGDVGDGVPNVLSSDNCFVVGERQKPLTSKRLEELMKTDFGIKTDHPAYRNYLRNKQLIDLTEIPDDVGYKIVESFDSQSGKKKVDLFNYFMAHRLKNLMENIGDFY